MKNLKHANGSEIGKLDKYFIMFFELQINLVEITNSNIL